MWPFKRKQVWHVSCVVTEDQKIKVIYDAEMFIYGNDTEFVRGTREFLAGELGVDRDSVNIISLTRIK